jgi:hypothetical protein
MLICSGIYKTPICMRNFGPTSDAMDWLLQRCRVFQRQHVKLYLKFQHGEWVTLENDATLLMAIEMVVCYYISTLDPRDSPPWMDDMDNAWEEHVDPLSDSEMSDDSQSDDYETYI